MEGLLEEFTAPEESSPPASGRSQSHAAETRVREFDLTTQDERELAGVKAALGMN